MQVPSTFEQKRVQGENLWVGTMTLQVILTHFWNFTTSSELSHCLTFPLPGLQAYTIPLFKFCPGFQFKQNFLPLSSLAHIKLLFWKGLSGKKWENKQKEKKSKRHSPLFKVYISSLGLANSFIYSSPVSTPFYTCWKHKITLWTLGSLPSIPFFVTFPPKSHYGVSVIATQTFWGND